MRYRIVILALIPVVGFVANGWTYLSDEREVGQAFQTVDSSRRLADASQNFKSAIAAMRITLKDFTVTPSNQLVQAFDQAQQVAMKSLATVASSVDSDRRNSISALQKRVETLMTNFDSLVAVQHTLGEGDGLRCVNRKPNIA